MSERKISLGGLDFDIPAEALAESIHKIGSAVDALAKVGLTRRAIIVLVSDVSKVNRPTVQQVLDGLGELRKTYLTESKR